MQTFRNAFNFLKKIWSIIMGAFPSAILFMGSDRHKHPVPKKPPPPPPKKPRILFLVKQRQLGPYSYSHGASGLLNSARFVTTMLERLGFDAKLVTCVDGNSVDKEVFDFKADIVFVEAYWVTPAKFAELQKLHPRVKFLVRNHSKPPFLATEGIAFEWTLAYMKQGVAVAFNSTESCVAFRNLATSHGIDGSLSLWLPNYYAYAEFEPARGKKAGTIDIGCFGAVRPLKNHVSQAFAAIEVADGRGEELRFHINATRIEGNGADNVLKSLRAMFAGTRHKLIEHGWLEHADFLKLMQLMNACMQVSFTETFNVVSADAVIMNVPVVGSPEIDWLHGFVKANPNDIEGICYALSCALTPNHEEKHKGLRMQRESLIEFNDVSESVWLDYLLPQNS